jgi:hypothetical protein
MAKPTYASRVPSGVDLTDAHVGAGLLGLPLTAQGERVAGVLQARRKDAALYPDVVVQMPRRATKTTAIWSTVLGRAVRRERYRCVVTAQSGNIASRILLDHAELMLMHGSCVESSERKGSDLPVLYRNGGREHLDFPATGSRIWVVPPDAGAVRSAAADDVVIDEAGEHDPRKFHDFMAGVRPLMDTRGPLAQMIVTGTPGKIRSGPFWEMLERGRKREPELGILDYSIRDDEDAEDRTVWRRVHPGPACGLTPMRTLEKRYVDLGPVAFAREYLCRWPFDSTVTAIDQEAWHAAELAALVLPERFGLAFDCCPDGSAAAVAAAWRVDGAPFVLLLDYRAGTGWVPGVVKAIRAKHRMQTAGDYIGANMPIFEALSRARPSVPVEYPKFRAIQGACQTFVDTLPAHQVQPDLERAAAAASWREVEGGRVFGRKASGSDISPLMAGVLALWMFDQRPERMPLTIRSA